MGLLGVLLSANKRKWFADLPALQFEEEKVLVIKYFMIPDNISYEKFSANSKWEFTKLSMYQDNNDLNNCTPSYRRYYSDSSYRSCLINDELGYGNDWFFIAYPDVAHWFEGKYDEIKESLTLQGAEFGFECYKNLKILRCVIIIYKEKFGRLECQI